MDAPYIISQLEKNIPVFRALFLEDVPKPLIKWRSQPEKWNLLEIACHVYDEERDDFRTRLKSVLEDPSKALPAIDPPGWVKSRDYNSKEMIKVVNDFLEERKHSVSWLRSLKNPPYDNAYIHPKFGPLSGKLLLSNWLAHDYLHFRQITKLKYDYLSTIAEASLDYAGKW